MTLLDLIDNFSSLNSEHTIFVKFPWSPVADAVAVATMEGKRRELSCEKELHGYHFFINVGIAQDYVHGWIQTLSFRPSPKQICERLIQYATDDA